MVVVAAVVVVVVVVVAAGGAAVGGAAVETAPLVLVSAVDDEHDTTETIARITPYALRRLRSRDELRTLMRRL